MFLSPPLITVLAHCLFPKHLVNLQLGVKYFLSVHGLALKSMMGWCFIGVANIVCEPVWKIRGGNLTASVERQLVAHQISYFYGLSGKHSSSEIGKSQCYQQ